MTSKVTIELSIKDFKSLSDYLNNHEYDIAYSLDDFDDLRGLFVEIFEQEPHEDDSQPIYRV